MTIYDRSAAVKPYFQDDAVTISRLRTFLLALRWRKSGESGLHWKSNKALEMGYVPENFNNVIKAGLVKRYPSGYCRLLPLGYHLLDESGVRWPTDTSFPKYGLCDPPNMHKQLPGAGERDRCGCPEQWKMH